MHPTQQDHAAARTCLETAMAAFQQVKAARGLVVRRDMPASETEAILAATAVLEEGLAVSRAHAILRAAEDGMVRWAIGEARRARPDKVAVLEAMYAEATRRRPLWDRLVSVAAARVWRPPPGTEAA